MSDTSRIYYLDNLKVFLIILVIMHHVAGPYQSADGSSFYSYTGEYGKELVLLLMFNASFFMGLFFFISGYFLPLSFDRNGVHKFINKKLIRFGIPLIFAALIMIPILSYFKLLGGVNSISFHDFYIQNWLGYKTDSVAVPHRALNFGHLWFVEHLLVYAILYAIIRPTLKKYIPYLSSITVRQTKLYAIILYILSLGMITSLMKTVWGFPINRWIGFLGFIQMEPAHIPQYLSLFILGIFAYRWSFLESITTPRHIFWLLAGIGIFIVTIIIGYSVGVDQAALIWHHTEALYCVGICIGLLALFKTLFNRTSSIMRILSENTYGTYILHIPVVVALQYLFDPFQAGAFTLFILVSLISIPGSFFISFLVRLLPGMKKIL